MDTIYRAVQSISVDYGIKEHAKNIYLVEGNFECNDMGSWESVYLAGEKDENGNSFKGEVIAIDSKNSYVYSDSGLIALIGLDDAIVVQEGNTTLVCSREKAEVVKLVINQLNVENKNQFL